MANNKIITRKSILLTFKKRLYTYIITVTALSGIFMTLVYLVAYKDQMTMDVRSLTATLAPNIAKFMEMEDKAEATSLINEELSNVKDISYIPYVSVLDHAQIVRYSWDRNSSDARINRNQTVEVDHDILKKSILYTRSAFTTANGKRFYIQYAIDATMSTRTLAKYLAPCYIITFGLILFGMVTMTKFLERTILRPITRLSDITAQIVRESDLSHTIEINSNDEVGELAGNISVLINKMKALLGDISNTVHSLGTIVYDLTNAGQDIIHNSRTTHEHSSTTTFMMQQLISSFTDVSEKLQNLNTQSDRSATTVNEMEQVNKMVVENVDEMICSVKDAANAISQITESINDNATHLDQLTSSINEVNGSMQLLDESITGEAKEAKESLQTAKLLSKNANKGLIAMENSNQGIQKIRESFAQAAENVQALGMHANDIGTILHVIEDVTKQTNLLALNAAIIAAQAGDSGHSFAVVSNEIAALAARTRNSTKEIAELIITIQEKTNQAITAISNSQIIIENGAKLGEAASLAYNELKNSADQAAQQSEHIAYSTLEQAEALKAISTSIEGITDTIRVINEFTHKQANDATSLDNAAQTLNALTKQVANSSAEQERSSKDVLAAIQIIANMSSEVSYKQKEQTEHTNNAVLSVQSIDENANHQEEAAQNLDDVIFAINQQSQQLNGYIKSFKV